MSNVLYENLKKIDKNGDIIELKEINHLKRIGLKFNKKSQVDTLTFIPLSKKVLSILSGNPNFTADDSVDMEFDEPESDSWESQNDEIEVFPIDEYSDRVDVLEVLRDNEERGKVIATQIKELQDTEPTPEPTPEPTSDNNTNDK